MSKHKKEAKRLRKQRRKLLKWLIDYRANAIEEKRVAGGFKWEINHWRFAISMLNIIINKMENELK